MSFRFRLNCFVCNVSQSAAQMSRINENALIQEIAISRRLMLERPLIETNDATRLCFTCKVGILNEIRNLEASPDCLRLNVVLQAEGHSCFVCNNNFDTVKVPLQCRLNVFMDYDIYIPEYFKCCQDHLNEEGDLLADIIPSLRCLNRPVKLRGIEINRLLDGLRHKNINSRFTGNENRFTDEEFKYFTSLSKQQFLDLFSFCEGVGSSAISKKKLLTFLVKIHHDISDDFLKIMFDYSSRQQVSTIISTVRKTLTLRFVPENIGVGSITREQFIRNHISEFANTLYNSEPDIPRAIVYIDGSYTYVTKSANFQALRQSYCVHKNRHLVKPQMIVGPDGYILDIQGPYFSDSRNNDAKILQNEFERNTIQLREWFRENDIFIMDRGYRDALPLLADLGLTVKMPPLLASNESQLNTESANESRLITKTRWIVESRNGHIKSIFKFFDGTIIPPHVLNLCDFYKIAGALINRYHGPISMEGADLQWARELLLRSQSVNVVQARVESDNLRAQRANWVPLTRNEALDFPHLTMHYLRDITIGNYQIKLAPSYVQDKLQRENDVTFKFDSRLDESGFLRCSVYSRFRNATKYQLWIAYETDDSEEPILGYYCTCKSGARTLGCCSHVASVLWFLGYARHVENVWYPDTAFLENVIDAGQRPIRRRDPNEYE